MSAHDRATTVLALASRDSKPDDFNRPGHIFPLKYREGGVLKRAGHTEASVDLAILAGLNPVAVLCEVVDDDGSMARLPKLRQFAEREILKIVSIADLVRYVITFQGRCSKAHSLHICNIIMLRFSFRHRYVSCLIHSSAD